MSNLTSILKKDSTFDRIFSWYIDQSSVKLSDKEQEIQQRWSAAWSLLMNYHSMEQAVAVHMKEFDLSRAQSYRDLKSAVNLFGNVTKTEKEGRRYVLYEYSMKVFQLALKKGDLETAGRMIERMSKLMRLDAAEDEIVNPEKLEASEYKIQLPKEIRDQLVMMVNKGFVDLNESAEDIDFEELGRSDEN